VHYLLGKKKRYNKNEKRKKKKKKENVGRKEIRKENGKWGHISTTHTRSQLSSSQISLTDL
jgi:hypothetical protein